MVPPRAHVRTTLVALLVPVLSGGCASPQQCVVVLGREEQSPVSFATLQLALDTVGPGSVLSICAALPMESVTVRQAVVLRGLPGARLQGLPDAPTLRIEPAADSVVVLQDIELVAPDASDQPALVVRGPADLRADGLEIESGADPQPFAADLPGLIDVESGRLELTRSTIEHDGDGSGAAIAARFGAAIVLEGSKISAAGQNAMLLESSDLKLTDVDIDDVRGTALRIEGGSARLLRVRLTNVGSAAMSLAAADVTMKSSILSGVRGRGIDAVGGTLKLEDVKVGGLGDDGIHTEGSVLQATDLSVSTAVGDGVEVIGGSLEIDRTTISGCGGHGLVATSCEGGVRSTAIDTVQGSGVVSTLATLELSSLALKGSARNGLEVLGGHVGVNGLNSQTHKRNGVLLGADAYLDCSSCVLAGGIEGIRVSGGSLLNLTGSRVENPITYGVSVRDGSFAWLVDTEIDGAGTGIFVSDEYVQCTATRVTVKGSVDAGVLVNGGTLTFLQSSASGSGSDGLRATGGTVTVGDSSFAESSLNGIFLLGKTRAQVKATVRANADWGLLCDGGTENATESTVNLQICDLVVADNGSGAVSLVNGCQQDQFCTQKAP
jgi:hypothetical protein